MSISTFRCVSGAAESATLTEEGSFVVTDMDGKTWVCQEINSATFNDKMIEDTTRQVHAMDAKLIRSGKAQSGELSSTRILVCRRDELPTQLAGQGGVGAMVAAMLRSVQGEQQPPPAIPLGQPFQPKRMRVDLTNATYDEKHLGMLEFSFTVPGSGTSRVIGKAGYKRDAFDWLVRLAKLGYPIEYDLDTHQFFFSV